MPRKPKKKREGAFAGTVGSHKKKTKQKQKQKQSQTVVINIGKEYGKKRKRQSRPRQKDKEYIQPAVIPPTVVYNTPSMQPYQQFAPQREIPILEAPTVKETLQSKPIEIKEDKPVLEDIENPKVIYPDIVEETQPPSQPRKGRVVGEPLVPYIEPKPKRKRRTKAQIEADKIAQQKKEGPLLTEIETAVDEPTKPKIGRPKGAKNKPKVHAQAVYEQYPYLSDSFVFPKYESSQPFTSAFEPIKPTANLYEPPPEVFRNDNPMRLSDLYTNSSGNVLTLQHPDSLEVSQQHPKLSPRQFLKYNSLHITKAKKPQTPSFNPDKKSNPPVILDYWGEDG